MRWAPEARMASMTWESQPLRGGSTVRQSMVWPSATSLGRASSAGAQRKEAFRMPFLAAFSLAFSTASGTTSMPMTFPAFRARSRLMVPMPQ